jgi:dimethylhistidine N-methyltransferase
VKALARARSASSNGARLAIVDAADGLDAELAADVRAGLGARRKTLPCRWLYDARGSQLFERICALPEYTLTRAEAGLIATHADRIAAALPDGGTLVELGSGSAVKTRLIITALLRRHGRLRYMPIDIAPAILKESALALIAEHPALEVNGIVADYHEGLRLIGAQRSGAKLVLWLGSNVGNFTRGAAARFLATLRRTLGRDDRLLLGVDLRKDRAALERAYDDVAGVTAAFNLNLLQRINRELGGEFVLDQFRHRVRWHERLGRIEMHLESRRAQRVRIAALRRTFTFRRGETIFTESSYKYDAAELTRLVTAAGFVIAAQFVDRRLGFAVNLLAPAQGPASSSPGTAAIWKSSS